MLRSLAISLWLLAWLWDWGSREPIATQKHLGLLSWPQHIDIQVPSTHLTDSKELSVSFSQCAGETGQSAMVVTGPAEV